MTEPAQPPAPPADPAALQWQIMHGHTPDGVKLCILVLTQGLLTTQVALNPYDTDKLGRQLVDSAAQARTGLIVPNGAAMRLGGDGGG